MKYRTANKWLTYVISIITMIFSVSALAITTQHEYLPLSEAKKLNSQSNEIKWRLHEKDGKRTLKMIATIPPICAEGARLSNNSALNKVHIDKWAISLNMPSCQTKPAKDSDEITAIAIDSDAELAYTSALPNFSVEIDPNFSGKVEVCHLKNGAPSEEIDDIESRMSCEEIQIELARGVSTEILSENALVSNKTLEEKVTKAREEREKNRSAEKAKAGMETISVLLEELQTECNNFDIDGAFSTVVSIVNSLNTLSDDDNNFRPSEVKKELLEVFLSQLEDIDNLEDLKNIYEKMDGEQKEEYAEKIAERVIQITLEEVEESIEDEEKVSERKIMDALADAKEFLEESLGSSNVYDRKEIKEKIKNLYTNAAKIVYKEDKEVTIEMLEKAKKYADSRGEIKIAKLQSDIYVIMSEKCFGRTSRAKDDRNFYKAMRECQKYAEKAKDIYTDNIELAEDVLDPEENENDEDLFYALNSDYYALFSDASNNYGPGLEGKFGEMTWEAYVEYMRNKQQAQAQQGRRGVPGPRTQGYRIGLNRSNASTSTSGINW